MWLWWSAGAILGGIWVWRLAGAFLGMRKVPDLATAGFAGPPWANGGGAPSVCVIVPACNEMEHVEPAVRSLLAQDYPHLRVVAVDDRSTDKTGEVLDRLACEFPGRLQVIRVTELPSGWLGKTHAMWLAAQNSTEDWLLFTDADVIYRADA